MSFREKLAFYAGGRVGVRSWTRRIRDSRGGNIFLERWLPTLRGEPFYVGPCGGWHTPERAKRIGKKLLQQIKMRLTEIKQEEAQSVVLVWSEEYDADDNTIYEAVGPYQEEDGTVFFFRIHAVLRGNSLRFSIVRTDSELISGVAYCQHCDSPFVFESLELAKQYCQTVSDSIRAHEVSQ